MKSLEVTINLVATADGVALVCQERYLSLAMPVQILRRASRCGCQERFTPGYASAIPTARVASQFSRTLFYAWLCQCIFHGALRVVVVKNVSKPGLNPLAIRGTRYLIKIFLLRYTFAATSKDLLFFVNQY
jgi:hypothetical protein